MNSENQPCSQEQNPSQNEFDNKKKAPQPHESDQPQAPHQNQESQQPKESQALQDQLKGVVESGAVVTNNGRHVIHCITIIGQIEGHYALPSDNKTTKYEHVIPQLVAVEESPEIEGLLILLNTVGGDIEAGLALAELIAGMSKPTVSVVLGGGHSIGVPLAVAAEKSFIVPSATMTIHPVRTNGLVLGVPQAFRHFERMQDRITKFVCANCRMKPERFRELYMTVGELVTDMGSILEGEQAVEEGLIDELGSLSDAIAALYEMIEAHQAGNPAAIPQQAGENDRPQPLKNDGSAGGKNNTPGKKKAGAASKSRSGPRQ